MYEFVLNNFRSDIMKYLDDAIDNNEEGIIVKDPLSIYKPNSRNSGWYKIKPEVNLYIYYFLFFFNLNTNQTYILVH